MQTSHLREAIVVVACLLSSCAQSTSRDPVTLTGKYAHEDENYAVEFHDGKCTWPNDAKEQVETDCFMRGDLIYLKPVVPVGEKMSRNVWVVYEIHDGYLESHHIEDLDDGTIFYKNFKPKVILRKQ